MATCFNNIILWQRGVFLIVISVLGNNQWKNNDNDTTVALNTVYVIPKRVLVDMLMEIMHCL